MPLLDYCGFLSMSGNVNKYTALQVLQNESLRTCIGYPAGYEMSRVDLHKRAKVSTLYQWWDKQLLNIIYDETRQADNIVEPVRLTHQALKLNLKQYKLHSKKYTNSPYIRGKNLWDKLTPEIQQLPDKFEFKERIKLQFSNYNESYLTK